MDVREKLVELQSIITCPNAICNFCEHFKNKSACEKHKKEVIADNMIAHGVTVQEWIPVTERLPEKNTSILGYSEFGRNIFWYDEKGFNDIDEYGVAYPIDSVTHWMPLPQPPKGE